MKRLDSNVEGFVQYGISSELAERAAGLGLTVTKVRTLSLQNLVDNFSLDRSDAKELKSLVQRKAIDTDTLYLLLERSNYSCNVCHAVKSPAFLIHHITPYCETQDNDYDNLVVLCPNDHDLAHHSGLSLGITIEGLGACPSIIAAGIV